MNAKTSALKLFAQLTSVPTAPFYEEAVIGKALAWIRKELGRSLTVKRLRGGVLVSYRKADGPALAFAAHLDHPGFHLSAVTKDGARADLQGGLLKELLPGARISAFAATPRDNAVLASGTLGTPNGDGYPVRWTSAPRIEKPVFAVLDLPAFAVSGRWLASRSIDDLLGCAVSLEALRVIAKAKLKTNVSVFLHRAEEVGFIGALEFISSGAVSTGDSILSIETSRELPDARPGRGPVIRTGDRATLFDPNLLALLDAAAARLKGRVKVQRARLTGGTCEATAYVAFGYESAGVAIPLVNYHNGGRGRVEPEKVRLEDIDGAVKLLVEAARLFPQATLRGKLRDRLAARHKTLSPLL